MNTLTILQDDRKDHNDFLIWQELQRYQDNKKAIIITSRTDEGFVRTTESISFSLIFNPFDSEEERSSSQSFIMRSRTVFRTNPDVIIIENLKDAIEQGLTEVDKYRMSMALYSGHNIVVSMPFSDDDSAAAIESRSFVEKLQNDVKNSCQIIHKKLS